MTSRPQTFVELSAALTGVDSVLLHGTGMVQTYLHKISEIVPSRLLERLFGTFAATGRNSAQRCLEAILEDEDLGPVARAITVLWYCGAWTGLPEAWHARNGDVPADTTRRRHGPSTATRGMSRPTWPPPARALPTCRRARATR